ncbi:MAG: hypothetical protein KAS29_12330, partial [Bacteroidales bacterium]|nr:hypothetical protein [Bacteroidales bacterium]
MFLILIPGAIISYLSMKSIQEKADNQKVKYLGTVNLVRDKLESEVIQRESNFRNSIIDSLITQEDEADLQILLQTARFDYPAFKNLLLIGNHGELIGSLVTLGLNQTRNSKNQINSELSRAISGAEKAEFVEKDFTGAINSYRKAFVNARSPGERVLLHARIGRNYYKLNQHENGIEEYEKILEPGDGSLTIGEVPAPIVALHQISEGYKALGALQDQKSTLFELYRQLLDHPWDLSGGEYLFYLRSTLAETGDTAPPDTLSDHEKGIPDEMIRREEKLMEEAEYIRLVQENILEEIMSYLKHQSSSETRNQLFPTGAGPAIEMNYFLLPPSIQPAHLKALAFQFDEEFLLTELFPGVLSAVDLGKDVTVGILNENDSLLFVQSDLQMERYLVAGSFIQFFLTWKVALFDTKGKSIEQLAGRERQLYLALFIGILAVMLIGIIVLARAVVHETEISRMKSEFVSNVTHELKTPLSLIRMFGETLESGIVTEEGKRQEFYSIIRK